MTKEWLDDRFHDEEESNKKKQNGNNDINNEDDSSDDDSLFSLDSNDTLHNFINFESHRNSTGLEEAVSLTYPFDFINNSNGEEEDKIEAGGEKETENKSIKISTLLEEDDLVPIFDGAGWAGTRVWAAAIWAIKYLVEEHQHGNLHLYHHHEDTITNIKHQKVMSLCELGCGLGVPGMIWHQMGGDVVLSDQERIMSQLIHNVKSNFEQSYVSSSSSSSEGEEEGGGGEEKSNENNIATIQVQPLDWSREGYQTLLYNTGFQSKGGFDILLNCDCVYEPLYGKSWEQLVEVMDECLKHNPKCLVVTSVERRSSDGIDDFVKMMECCEYVGKVEKVLDDKGRKLELYVTTGKV